MPAVTGTLCLAGLTAVVLFGGLLAVAEVLAKVWALVTAPMLAQEGCAAAFAAVTLPALPADALTAGETTAEPAALAAAETAGLLGAAMDQGGRLEGQVLREALRVAQAAFGESVGAAQPGVFVCAYTGEANTAGDCLTESLTDGIATNSKAKGVSGVEFLVAIAVVASVPPQLRLLTQGVASEDCS